MYYFTLFLYYCIYLFRVLYSLCDYTKLSEANIGNKKLQAFTAASDLNMMLELGHLIFNDEKLCYIFEWKINQALSILELTKIMLKIFNTNSQNRYLRIFCQVNEILWNKYSVIIDIFFNCGSFIFPHELYFCY